MLAELDYLLMRQTGRQARVALLAEVARGAYQLETFGPMDIAHAIAVVEKYDLKIGLTDASLVVLAERHGIAEVLTLDRRHFRVMHFARRRHCKILPGDSGA